MDIASLLNADENLDENYLLSALNQSGQNARPVTAGVGGVSSNPIPENNIDNQLAESTIKKLSESGRQPGFGDVYNSFKEGGFWKGLGKTLQYAGSPEGQKIIGGLVSSSSPYAGQYMVENADKMTAENRANQGEKLKLAVDYLKSRKAAQPKEKGTTFIFDKQTGAIRPTNISSGKEGNEFLTVEGKKPDVDDKIDEYERKLRAKERPKALGKLNDDLSEAEITKNTLREAIQAAKNIPTGIGGRIKLKALELAGSNDPVLSDLQTVQNALAKLQLEQLQFTKGAVSDAEMTFFADSIGNGDVKSLPRMITSFEKGIRDIEMREKAARDKYNSIYGDAIENQTQPSLPTESNPEEQDANKKKVLTATNPKTGQKIKSVDGGKTWQPM